MTTINVPTNLKSFTHVRVVNLDCNSQVQIFLLAERRGNVKSENRYRNDKISLLVIFSCFLGKIQILRIPVDNF